MLALYDICRRRTLANGRREPLTQLLNTISAYWSWGFPLRHVAGRQLALCTGAEHVMAALHRLHLCCRVQA